MKIEKLSIDEIINAITAEKKFHAVAEDYSFIIKIEKYVPYVCGAVHDGHHFRSELWDNCLLNEYERWYEEDPATLEMVRSQPITIAGLDSRFEYDLNREPQTAIYEDAWGKKMWKVPLSEEETNLSLSKHTNFYKVVHALISKLESKFGRCIVYDMHSYNWKRWDREVPTWNLGTSNIDNERFGNLVEKWRKFLSDIEMPDNLNNGAKVNDTFQGNGYFLKYITKNFKNTLVLATEISKVYGDELRGIIYPEVVNAVALELEHRIPEHAQLFLDTIKT